MKKATAVVFLAFSLCPVKLFDFEVSRGKDIQEKQKEKSLICTKKIFIKCSKTQLISHSVGKTDLGYNMVASPYDMNHIIQMYCI